MDSILVSYTDGVLNIDRADAGRKGERGEESETERERGTFFFFSFDLITL